MNDAQSPEATEPTTIAEYLNAHALRVSPLDGAAAAELGFTVPVPAGWQPLDPAQFPGATQVIVEPNLVETQYLVQFTVTTLASQLEALAFDVAAINDGLTTSEA